MRRLEFDGENESPKEASPCEAYRAFAPGVEVNGDTLQAMVKGLFEVDPGALKILARHGLDHSRPGQWYPQQAWLDAFRDVAETLGPNALFLVGHRILESAEFPDHLRSLPEALAAIDDAYHRNHRGGAIGSYAFEPTGPRSGRVICANPYPSDFDRGIIQAVADRFKPEGSHVSVQLDFRCPTRKSGGRSCTFLVAW